LGTAPYVSYHRPAIRAGVTPNGCLCHQFVRVLSPRVREIASEGSSCHVCFEEFSEMAAHVPRILHCVSRVLHPLPGEDDNILCPTQPLNDTGVSHTIAQHVPHTRILEQPAVRSTAHAFRVDKTKAESSCALNSPSRQTTPSNTELVIKHAHSIDFTIIFH